MQTAESGPDFEIRCGGRRLPPEAHKDVKSVTVLEDLNALSMFTVTLKNWDADRLAVTWSDSTLFAVGTEVRIALGYVKDLHLAIIGEITSLEPSFVEGRPPMLTVRGYDLRHRLARRQRTRTFTRTRDSAIARQLAEAAGLRADVTDTGTDLDYVLQNNETDLEFLRRRAGLIGYEIHVRDKVLTFRPPQHGRAPAAKLHVGDDISQFTPRLRTMGQMAEHSVRGWDVTGKKAVVAVAGSGPGPTTTGAVTGPRQVGRVFGRTRSTRVDLSAPNQARADQLARGQFDDLALSYITGEAECGGQPRLHAGEVVRIEGAGATFSGDYYVVSVSHSVTAAHGYRSSLEVRRNAA
ncbi:contractile injection system protein, VgrG/Pvc8 family [Solwaraspora sp. WMMA2065]|uniref:phage late control D family protein n=1 Tax=Solwaraspora sp. WMMA2065 TaxID=3015166 RepID=UPI00259B93AD|nr:contractile injection system protein, VgrG/Pvc8 family [Solwaraspora sp. WMMA2065]WJK37740.1 contractile injection system protein, VgrG/Pvc8 family [Solwaraspora sp. WMMA2065]